MLLALAASHGLHIHQMDVKTSFLYVELHEEKYMEQPEAIKFMGKRTKCAD
jgi:hypothetical protein